MNILPLFMPHNHGIAGSSSTFGKDHDLWHDTTFSLSEIIAYSYSPATVPAYAEDGYISTVIALARHADSFSTSNGNHITQTAAYAKTLGKKLGCSAEDIVTLSLAGLLHDVGKAFIPEAILTKPGVLSATEWMIMQQHPVLGVRILRPAIKLSRALPIVLSHHEHYDGSGYPNKLSGEEIPFGARIISVVDAFTTMTNGRVYQKEMTREEASLELVRCSGKQFDGFVTEAFLEILKEEKN